MEIKGIHNVVKNYASILDNGTYALMQDICNEPAYSKDKIVLMPDAHVGKGCAIGTTIKYVDKVNPSFTGVDLGCGVLCVPFKGELDFAKLDMVIKRFIPVGNNIFNVASEASTNFVEGLGFYAPIDVDRAARSLGTLGSGNHFIEVATWEGDTHALVIHSGSRHLGLEVANYHIKKSKNNKIDYKPLISFLKENHVEQLIQEFMDKIESNKSQGVGYLEGKDLEDYLHDVSCASLYAHYNRTTMARNIFTHMGWKQEGNLIESVHNYIDVNNKILRKGAISAQKGERVIIPLNMRDGSIIGVGKGNADWNYSAPHGAGRLMGRSQAREGLNVELYEKSMEGIYSTTVGIGTLDEAPMAYKPMNIILDAIESTVEVEKIIKPLYNFKA